jgi:chromosome segregation ATPase
MPSQDEQKIKGLENRIKAVNEAKIRAEAQLEELRKQRDTILQRLTELKIDPGSLGEQLEQMKRQLANDLKNIEDQIPGGF